MPVVTFDHEHVPPPHLTALADEGHACRPGPKALVHAQDKTVMRAELDSLGIPNPRHAVVSSVEDVVAFAKSLGDEERGAADAHDFCRSC